MPHPADPGESRFEVHTVDPGAGGDTLVAYAELRGGEWQMVHRDGRAVTVASRMEVIERLLAVCAHTSSCGACGGTIEYAPDGSWRHCLPPEEPHPAGPGAPRGHPRA